MQNLSFINPFILTLSAVIVLDIILGILRAIKDRKLNSTFGINGIIRKTAMLVCIAVLAFIDTLFSLNLLFLLPKEMLSVTPKVGISDFFTLLFIAFEGISVLKNMALCDLPIPKKLRNLIEDFLKNMTDEIH